jgi:CRP-like cAMP-binding protein
VLDALVALHAADTPEARQVLHDRLVECGASAEAAYVRLQRALGAISSADSALVQRAARSLREASRLVGPTFRYLVARDVEGCAGLRWALRCPKSWHQLRDLGQAESRYCDTCRQEVFRVSTEFEAQRLGREGRCVALFIDDDRVEMGEVA